MTNALSKTQIDKLGERLKQGSQSDDDLRMLDSYRQSFGETYEYVVSTIRDRLGFQPTGRQAKSTTSIREKLKRANTRLSSMQDIAGCRLVVGSTTDQDQTVEVLKSAFENTTIIDRRAKPSHGYRAVHVIIKHANKLIEVQIRTALQHIWAELSEKLSDMHEDQAIKYGGGPDDIKKYLRASSELAEVVELLEKDILAISNILKNRTSPPSRDLVKAVKLTQEKIHKLNSTIIRFYRKTIEKLG